MLKVYVPGPGIEARTAQPGPQFAGVTMVAVPAALKDNGSESASFTYATVRSPGANASVPPMQTSPTHFEHRHVHASVTELAQVTEGSVFEMTTEVPKLVEAHGSPASTVSECEPMKLDSGDDGFVAQSYGSWHWMRVPTTEHAPLLPDGVTGSPSGSAIAGRSANAVYDLNALLYAWSMRGIAGAGAIGGLLRIIIGIVPSDAVHGSDARPTMRKPLRPAPSLNSKG
jgi:hypothetical protein